MSSCSSLGQVMALVDARLDDQASSEIMLHLRSCASCAALYEALRSPFQPYDPGTPEPNWLDLRAGRRPMDDGLAVVSSEPSREPIAHDLLLRFRPQDACLHNRYSAPELVLERGAVKKLQLEYTVEVDPGHMGSDQIACAEASLRFSNAQGATLLKVELNGSIGEVVGTAAEIADLWRIPLEMSRESF